MIAFDTDVISDLIHNVPAVVAKFAMVPVPDQFLPIVVVEEVLRGRLASVRLAQSGAGKATLEKAYAEFEKTLIDLKGFQVLPYTTAADGFVRTWRAMKIRIGTQDLRIAAIAFAHNAKLVTRNARDYTLVPGLNLEVWN